MRWPISDSTNCWQIRDPKWEGGKEGRREGRREGERERRREGGRDGRRK